VDAAVLADPDQAGQSALEDAVHVPAELNMWLSPLPVAMKLGMIAPGRIQRSLALLVSAEPGAEPDLGRLEVPRSVDAARAR